MKNNGLVIAEYILWHNKQNMARNGLHIFIIVLNIIIKILLTAEKQINIW